ncbi:hypothetical protein [Candidatus Poriferisodalis sp.]|uniref:hypothetical protein n=1 Tax=Candidatus Poriferisodalis sp. TaxID=3101277 RepID=UPI003B021295
MADWFAARSDNGAIEAPLVGQVMAMCTGDQLDNVWISSLDQAERSIPHRT